MNIWIAGIASLLAWALFIVIFAFKMGAQKVEESERRRDARSLLGLGLQGVGYLVVPAFLREIGSPLFLVNAAYSDVLEQIVLSTAVVMELGSLWLIVASIRTLGKQWAVSARVIDIGVVL